MMRTAWIAALIAAALAGCGSDKCATESPQVTEVASCTVAPGAPIDIPLRLCPTCNQTLSECAVDMSGVGSGIIQLDPIVEACESSASCPSPACELRPTTCRVVAPTAPDVYDVLVFDPQANGPVPGVTLTVTPDVTGACEPLG